MPGRWSHLYDSKYLNSDDLAQEYTTVRIESVGPEMIYQGHGKPDEELLCLSFAGTRKRLVLRKTTYYQLVDLLGEIEDEWVGQKVRLWKTKVKAFGEMVWAIRFKGVAAGEDPPRPEPEPRGRE